MFPFEQLEVYKKAYNLNQQVYKEIKKKDTIAPYIRNQLGRASLSIMLNIAEGSAKGSNRDRKNYFVTARGSAFECCSIICFLHEEADFSEELKNELYGTLEEISKILFVMIRNLNV